MCSTPFGIYEVGTTSRTVRLCDHQGAQRLSASMRLAPQAGALGLDMAQMCSTPFGIYEVGTCGRCGLAERLSMCSTPFGIYEVGTRDPQRQHGDC